MFSGLIKWFKLPMYSITDVSGKVIDVQGTFQPTFCPIGIILFIKISILALSIAALIESFIVTYSEDILFYFAFLTSWGFLLSLGYLLVTLIGQFYGRTPPSSSDEPQLSVQKNDISIVITSTRIPHDDDSSVTSQELNVIHRITWTLFTVAINLEFIITCLFWLLVYSGYPLLFSDVYNHGGVLLALIIDGYGIHHYPIRFRQIVWVYPVFFLFVIWSYIHGAANLGNPLRQDNDPDTDDDALYAPLNWKKRPGAAAIITLLVGTVLIPLFHVFMWGLSMIFQKRYL